MAGKQTVISDHAHGAHYHPEMESVATTGRNLPDQAGAKHSRQRKEPDPADDVIAYWGDDNLLPQNLVQAYEKNSIIPATIDWKIRALYGSGVIYGRKQRDSEGNEYIEPVENKNVENFLRQINIKRYLMKAISNFYHFYNFFPEMILSKDRSKIVSLKVNEASYCRWELQDKNGVVNRCYISPNWEENISPRDAIKVPVMDPHFDAMQEIKEGTQHKYIYPISYPSSGRTYYPLIPWDSIRKSKWLDVANAIPTFKKNLFDNQLSIKYHIEIAVEYWPWKFPDWDSFDTDTKKQKVKEEVETINTMLQGKDKAGGTYMSPTTIDHIEQKTNSYVKITPIDDKIKDGIYIEDSQEASSHILYALGVDPTLTGSGPGKNATSAGSGSDKRVAFNIYLSMVGMHEDIILEPIDFALDYNGWRDEGAGLHFKRNQVKKQSDESPAEREPQQQSS